jgi:hypothetical protein
MVAPATLDGGARVRRGKRRGDQGDHVGLLTLDEGGRRDGRRRTTMAVGSGSCGRRRSGEPLAVGRGWEGSARHGEAPGGVDFTRRTAAATNRRRRHVDRRWCKGGASRSRGRQCARARGRLGRVALKGAGREVPWRARQGDRRRHAVLAMAGLARWASAGQAARPERT